jgi:hypothetical protein
MNAPLDWILPLVPEEIVIVSALAALLVDFVFVRQKTLAMRAAVVGRPAWVA